MRSLNKELRKQNFTHTMNRTKTGRLFYYDIINGKTVGKKQVLQEPNCKVYSLISQEDVTASLKTYQNYNQKTIELLKKGFTHIKYENRKYYNLQTQDYESFHNKTTKEIDSIKVFCNQTGKDITDLSILSIKRSLLNFGGKVATSTISPKELRKKKFTHKRCFNRKFYDLNKCSYVNIEQALENPHVKIYDEKSTSDVTSHYKNNY